VTGVMEANGRNSSEAFARLLAMVMEVMEVMEVMNGQNGRALF
jgi:hypothetical protein